MAKMRNSVISEGFAGSAGSATFRGSVVGQQLTVRTNPRDARSERQVEARGDFTEGSDGYGLLSASAKKAWAQAAKASRRKDPVTSKSYAIQPRALYIGLASKFAQINPGAALPTMPPIAKYKGDTLSFTLRVLGTTCYVDADKANNASSTTELLVARMPSADRAPREEDYVTQDFVKYAEGAGLTAQMNLSPGYWAVATRFCCPQTGEEKGIVPLGTFRMGLAVVGGGLDEGEDASEGKKAA